MVNTKIKLLVWRHFFKGFFSVAHPVCLSRIPDPGSRIPDPTTTTREGGKKGEVTISKKFEFQGINFAKGYLCPEALEKSEISTKLISHIAHCTKL
jgi:hypothetical protein